MPKGKGLYTRKGASGRTMYFRDGKLISERSYRTSVSRRRGATPKRRSNPRARTRRKTVARRKTYRRKPAMPHPSITGLAAGLSVASYLNSNSGIVLNEALSIPATAFKTLADNAQSMSKTDPGRATLASAIVIAAAGGWVRKALPSIKLGGSKIYMRV